MRVCIHEIVGKQTNTISVSIGSDGTQACLLERANNQNYSETNQHEPERHSIERTMPTLPPRTGKATPTCKDNAVTR